MNTYNADGFTPLLCYVDSFVKMRDDLWARIAREVEYNVFKHKENADVLDISNVDLFSDRTETD